VLKTNHTFDSSNKAKVPFKQVYLAPRIPEVVKYDSAGSLKMPHEMESSPYPDSQVSGNEEYSSN